MDSLGAVGTGNPGIPPHGRKALTTGGWTVKPPRNSHCAFLVGWVKAVERGEMGALPMTCPPI